MSTFTKAAESAPEHDSRIPEGWKENPSRGSARTKIAFFSAIAALLLMQASPEPSSSVALWYGCVLASGIAGLAGTSRRWFAVPWFVVLSFALSLTALLFSIHFAIVVPSDVGHLAPFRLLATLCMANAFAISTSELLASMQNLRRYWNLGRSPLRAFLGRPTRRRRSL